MSTSEDSFDDDSDDDDDGDFSHLASQNKVDSKSR